MLGKVEMMGWNQRRLGGLVCSLLVWLLFIDDNTAFGKEANSTDNSKITAAATDGGAVPRPKNFFGDAQTEFTLMTGYRTDELDWSIAGNGVNILSELDWSDVESYQVALTGGIQFKNNVYLRGGFNYAWIDDGTVRDSDYGEDGRGAEWSRSISETTGDQLWDVTGGGGYSFCFLRDRFTVTPLIGLSYHKQNLRIQNGTQVMSGVNPFGGSSPPPEGPLSSQLNSTYFARWFGPWIGVDLRFKPKTRPPVRHAMELRMSLELHWAEYYGEGNWNLRSVFRHPKSFEHDADGFGISLTAQWLLNLVQQWDLTITASHQDWSTDDGVDRKFLAAGGTVTTALNEVNWESTSLMVGVQYRF
jgi:hypothetical protein